MSRMKAHPRVFWHRLKDHVRRFGWIWLAVFLILSLVNHRWHLPLVATQPQVLGEDQYFVRGTHKDSYDSRYEAFGLIDRCRFSGKAHPLF